MANFTLPFTPGESSVLASLRRMSPGQVAEWRDILDTHVSNNRNNPSRSAPARAKLEEINDAIGYLWDEVNS